MAEVPTVTCIKAKKSCFRLNKFKLPGRGGHGPSPKLWHQVVVSPKKSNFHQQKPMKNLTTFQRRKRLFGMSSENNSISVEHLALIRQIVLSLWSLQSQIVFSLWSLQQLYLPTCSRVKVGSSWLGAPGLTPRCASARLIWTGAISSVIIWTESNLMFSW